jgi:hypothetical protein
MANTRQTQKITLSLACFGKNWESNTESPQLGAVDGSLSMRCISVVNGVALNEHLYIGTHFLFSLFAMLFAGLMLFALALDDMADA